MSAIVVQGGNPLHGEINIQGSKNAVLPMMAASILHNGTTVITHVPRIQDVYCMMGILKSMGCTCFLDGHTLIIDTSGLTTASIPEKYMRSMRSSIMLLGALLARTGEALTYYPGGCSIGSRPIDLHLHALRTLGAEIVEKEDCLQARCSGFKGADISFYFPSVGATENALLAAVLAEGTTTLHGAAKEPEIDQLCLFLNRMGARISGIGTSSLTVNGVKKLHDSVFEVCGDRIVAGTYMAAAAAATGELLLTGIDPGHLAAVIRIFREIGLEIRVLKQGLWLKMERIPKPVTIRTEPYPGFPTDLQSPLMSVLCRASGSSRIEETVFEGRYKTAIELQKMGAPIIIEEGYARIGGTAVLKGCQVTAPDLRGGAALVVAGLSAEGDTYITGCQHIMRGYEDIGKDLRMLGAGIRSVL